MNTPESTIKHNMMILGIGLAGTIAGEVYQAAMLSADKVIDGYPVYAGCPIIRGYMSDFFIPSVLTSLGSVLMGMTGHVLGSRLLTKPITSSGISAIAVSGLMIHNEILSQNPDVVDIKVMLAGSFMSVVSSVVVDKLIKNRL